MLEVAKVDIETDASGDATVYLTHGINRRPRGMLYALRYVPGTLAAGADLTITGESSEIPVLTVANAGTSDVFWYPRAILNEVADGAAGVSGSELIPIVDERIKVVVAQGGNATSGSMEAIIFTDPPY